MTYTIDGTELATIRTESVELVEKADHGAVGAGSWTIDDAGGTIAIVGHKGITGTEPFRAYVGERRSQRGPDKADRAREIDVTLLDLNARLAFNFIHGTGSRRPQEEIGERLTWLLGSSALSGLVSDLGFVDYPTTIVDPNDYRGQFPSDVLRDLALVAGANFFAYYDPDEDAVGLWFRDANASTTFSSTLRISTSVEDVDSETTFAAGGHAELTRDPSQVISQVWMPYARGNVIRTRAATEDNFPRRGGVAPSSDVKRRDRARTIAYRYLLARRNEEDTITDEILVPAEKIGEIRAGQRIEARYTFLGPEGYGDFSWFRILETRKEPVAEGLYRVGLIMSPQETVPVFACDSPTDINLSDGTVTVGEGYVCRHLFTTPPESLECGSNEFSFFNWEGRHDGHPASNVNDGDGSTYCEVPSGVLGGDMIAVLQSDLGADALVSSYTWAASPSDLPNVFRYSDSATGPWTDISGSYSGSDTYIFDAPITARYWQIGGSIFNSTPGWQGNMQRWSIMGCIVTDP